MTWVLFNQLSLREIKDLYGTRHIGRDQARRLVGLMDVFCFSEVHWNRSAAILLTKLVLHSHRAICYCIKFVIT
jgi:hypothetical protein